MSLCLFFVCVCVWLWVWQYDLWCVCYVIYAMCYKTKSIIFSFLFFVHRSEISHVQILLCSTSRVHVSGFFFVVPLCGFEIFYSIFLIDLHSNFCWIILTFFFHLLNCLNVCLSRLIYPLQLKQWWWSISQYNQSCSNFYTSRYMLAKPYNAHSNCLCNINSILFDLYTRIS